MRTIARAVSALFALAFRPVPAHATQAARLASGKTIREAAETGERGDRRDPTPAGTPSPAYPDVEDAPGWVAHPHHRHLFTDEELGWRLAVWTEEVSR
jgi:hypothetical protein